MKLELIAALCKAGRPAEPAIGLVENVASLHQIEGDRFVHVPLLVLPSVLEFIFVIRSEDLLRREMTRDVPLFEGLAKFFPNLVIVATCRISLNIEVDIPVEEITYRAVQIAAQADTRGGEL